MFNKLYEKIKRSQERRVAYWQLNNLTDKELHDIGISRGQIYEVING
jgi:uncharacterized protein YjiS (DUF1127 family)